MSFETNSTNPVVRAIAAGTAPRPAQMAAARGVLPLSHEDLIEVLVGLARGGDDAELQETARGTLRSQDETEIETLLKSEKTSPQVLTYFVEQDDLPQNFYEAILTNRQTPGDAILKFARGTTRGELLEIVALNQQFLIGNPQVIDAIIGNSYRTAEAERRASEIKREFFEKQRGAEQIANELRARGQTAAAEFIEQAEFAAALSEKGKTDLSFEDAILLAEHIEVPDAETDDSWLALDYIEELYEETEEQRQFIVNKILGELRAEDDEISGERVSMINRIMRMGMKDRVKLAMKGDREARNILIRDPNRIVAQAVVSNARITEQEVEKIASMRTIPEEILRQIAINRNWARNYSIMHNLARNPRTPIANVITILTRLQLRDLTAIAKNRNVSDAVRQQALRLSNARKGAG